MTLKGDECPRCGNREWKDITEARRNRNQEVWESGLLPDIYHSQIQREHFYECLNCGRVITVSDPMQQGESG